MARLWHKDLIRWLPDKALITLLANVADYASGYAEAFKGSRDNTILALKKFDQDKQDLKAYGALVEKEINYRKLAIPSYMFGISFQTHLREKETIFSKWQDDDYLREDYYILKNMIKIDVFSQKDFQIIEQYIVSYFWGEIEEF